MATTLQERLELAFARNPSLSKADLARACGVRPPSVSDWFNGRTKRLTGMNLINAANYLGVTESWLATGRGGMDRVATVSSVTSHPQRPDPEILVATQAFLERAFGALGKSFSLASEADLFADVYEWVASDERPIDERNLVDFARWRAARNDKETVIDEQDRGAAGEAGSADQRRASG